MTIRRTATIVDATAVRTAVIAARLRAAYSEAGDAEAARIHRGQLDDGTVVVGVLDAPPPPPTEAELVAERIRAMRARMGGAARPLR